MESYLDCIPCFFRQMLEGARLIRASSRRQKEIMDAFAGMIPKISLEFSPPEIARRGHALLKKIGRNADPYKEIKQKSNRMALKLFGRLKKKVQDSHNPLLKALELAIAGNVIDFGAKNHLNIREELRKILQEERKIVHKRSVFHYAKFREALKSAKSILYLADNAGEVVFDRILMEEIHREYPRKKIYYAVKARPILNDALMEDARACDIDRVARVISNGADAPGTILSLCSSAFREIYRKADMVISKGQGNFESLSKAKRPIFFLFMVKCPMVARETGHAVGSIVLHHTPGKRADARRS